MPPEDRHVWVHRGARRAFLAWLGRSCAVVLLALGSPTGVGAASATGEAETELRAGAPVERALASGESHRYRLEVPTAGSLLVTVEQRGIDLAVGVVRPDGRELPPVDGPNDREGPETVLIPPDPPGSYRIEVRAPVRAVAPGRYEIRVETLPDATAADRERLTAERLMTEGGRLSAQATAEALGQAVARYQEALVHWRSLGEKAALARALAAVAVTQWQLGRPPQALAAFREALPLWQEVGDEGAAAAALTGISLALSALGDGQQAIAAAEQAVALQQARGNLYGEALARDAICLVHHARGETAAALPCYEQALALWQRNGDGEFAALALQNIGGTYDSMGEPRQAVTRYDQALAVLRASGNRRAEGEVLSNLGVAWQAMGDLGKALALFEQAQSIFRELGDLRLQARAAHNLGTVDLMLSEPERARGDFEAALRLRRETGDRRGAAISLSGLARVYERLGDREREVSSLHQGIELAKAVKDRREEAVLTSQLGDAELAAGHFAGAVDVLGAALAGVQAVPDRDGEAVVRFRLGRAYLGLGQLPDAQHELEQARDLHRETGNVWGEAETLCALARLDRRRGHLAAAQSAVAASLALVESLRGSLNSPGLRTSFGGSLREAFELDVDLKMELERREPGRGHAREALEASERARARTLLELLREVGTDIRQGVDPALREREQSLRERLNAKAGRQVELASGNAGEPRKEAARQEVEALLRELEEVQAEIRRQSPRYAALIQPRPITLPEIQALLDGRTLLLEYALGEERSFLWAVSRDGMSAFELPRRAVIEAAARTVYDQMRVVHAGPQADPQAAARLSRILLGPVAASLGEKRLAIVADGALQYLPFAALPDPARKGSRGAAEPLFVRHEVVGLPAAALLAAERGAPARREAGQRLVAVLADPVFDRADPRLRPGGVRGVGPAGPERLPATRREAEAIASLAPAGQVMLALDFRASRATALSPEMAGFRILHFATHGLIDTRTPALSGLLLSQVAADGTPQEGLLGLEDVYNLRLAADLVVLSGCDTALGREVRGEGLVGLTQGFFYAGARRVVASLWPVQERATTLLMTRFYRAMLVEGVPPAAALREAQKAVWRQPRLRAPTYWAPFVLLGDWN